MKLRQITENKEAKLLKKAKTLKGDWYVYAYGKYEIFRDGKNVKTSESRMSASLYSDDIKELK